MQNQVERVKAKPFIRESDIRWLFHIVVALFFIRVWVWHVSPESADRYSRQQYGGFFRYLTFCCFTVQVLQLILATLTDFTPKGKGIKLKRDADDLSCVVFVLANCVTLLFHAIEFLTPGGILLENHLIVHWIDITTHKLNSVVAWLDIIFCHPRRFSYRSLKLLFTFFIGYASWMYFLRIKTGIYPYRFLNELPHPYGFFMMLPICVFIISVFFLLGRTLSRWTQNVMNSEGIESLDNHPKPAKQTPSDKNEVDSPKLD